MYFRIEIRNVEKFVAGIKAKGIEPYKDIYERKYNYGNNTSMKKEVVIIDPDGYLLRLSETEETSIWKE